MNKNISSVPILTAAARFLRSIARKPRVRAAAILALAAGLTIAGAAAHTNHYVSWEAAQAIAAGCRSDNPAERAAWELLRDAFLPAYREAVAEYEKSPIPLEAAKVERRLIGHARGHEYSEYCWYLRPEKELYIKTVQALDLQRNQDALGREWPLVRYGVTVGQAGTDGTVIQCDREYYYQQRNLDWDELDWTDYELTLPGNDFSEIAQAFMAEIGERHLLAADHNSAGADAYEILGVEIRDTIPDSHNAFVFRGSFHFAPVDADNAHWTSDDAETVFNDDGTLDYTADFAVERAGDNTWRISEQGFWVAAKESGGWYRDDMEAMPAPLSASSDDPETIAQEFFVQYAAQLWQLYDRKNLCGARAVEISGITLHEFDEKQLCAQGVLPEHHPEAFYITACADITLPSQPMKWQWYASSQYGYPLQDGRQRYWLGLLFWQEWDGWTVKYCSPEHLGLVLLGEPASPDGKWQFSVSEHQDGLRFTLSDTAQGTVCWERTGDETQTVLWSPDSRYAAVTCTARHFQEVFVVDTRDFSAQVIPAPEPPDGIFLRPIDLAATSALEWTDSQTLYCRTRFQIVGDDHRYQKEFSFCIAD